MEDGKIILDKERFDFTIKRLAHQIIEEYDDLENTCIIGIQERGVMLSDRIIKEVNDIVGNENMPYGKLDITFFRDDFRTREEPLRASQTDMPFLVDGRDVILVDDVLYTGRTISAAMNALQAYGRPKRVELLTLVDRRFNRHLPIKADYSGIRVDSLDEAYVKVEWSEKQGEDKVLLFSKRS